MRKPAIICVAIGLLAAFAGGEAVAGQIDLFDYGYNVDGTSSVPTFGDPVPTNVDESGFDDLSGLGTITATFNTAGSHYMGLWVDHEIDETVNTYFNEYGSKVTSPAPPTGLSWEIDEPGYSFGDIFANFEDGTLDGTNDVGAGFEDDVSMALAWDFSLNAGDKATVTFTLTQSQPTSGFYLAHRDPDSIESIYFYSNLNIQRATPGIVPLPPAFALAIPGLGLAFAARLRRRRKK